MLGWFNLIFWLFIAILVMWLLRQGIIISNYHKAIRDAREMMEKQECLNRLVSIADVNLESWRKLRADVSVEERNSLDLRILRENMLLGKRGEDIIDLYRWIQAINIKHKEDKVSLKLLGTNEEEFDKIVKWFECNRL